MHQQCAWCCKILAISRGASRRTSGIRHFLTSDHSDRLQLCKPTYRSSKLVPALEPGPHCVAQKRLRHWRADQSSAFNIRQLPKLMAFASSFCRIAINPASLLRPSCISATASRTFSIAPLRLTSSPCLNSSIPQLGALRLHKGSFLSGSARTGAFKSATWQPVTGRGALRNQTTMASADKPIQLYSLATPNGQKVRGRKGSANGALLYLLRSKVYV